MQENIQQATHRIERMERTFDTLSAAFYRDAAAFLASKDALWQLKELSDYYESGLWLHDYQLDEQGLLPRNLKRGVLSEDGVYNFLADIAAARADSEAGL